MPANFSGIVSPRGWTSGILKARASAFGRARRYRFIYTRESRITAGRHARSRRNAPSILFLPPNSGQLSSAKPKIGRNSYSSKEYPRQMSLVDSPRNGRSYRRSCNSPGTRVIPSSQARSQRSFETHLNYSQSPAYGELCFSH